MSDAKKPSQPASAANDELGAQLDSLLSQIEKPAPQGGAAAGVPAARAQAAMPAAEADAPAEADKDDGLGGDLAAQIQQLLDDARKQPDDMASAPAEAAVPAAEAVKPAPAELTPAAAAAAEPVDVAQIDQMLAEEADDAVAGDFETVNEVLGDGQRANVDAQTPAGAAHAQAEEPAVAERRTAAPLEAHEAPAIAEEPAGFSATAKSVARELDEEVRPAARTAPRRRAEAAKPVKPDKPPARARGGLLALLRHLLAAQIAQSPSGLRSLCTLLSRPLAKASPQVRDTVGYIGLITLFWGSITVAAKVASTFFGAH